MPISASRFAYEREDKTVFPDPASYLVCDSNDNIPPFQVKGIYLMLTGPSESIYGRPEYNWSLVIADSPVTGVKLRQIQQPGNGNTWTMESERIDTSKGHPSRTYENFLVSIRIGKIDNVHQEVWVEAVKECISAVNVPGHASCHLWCLRAIFELAQAGLLTMGKGLLPLVRDLDRVAMKMANARLEQQKRKPLSGPGGYIKQDIDNTT